jgi:GH24 family phage-related lysozyme (muramidase)
VSARPLPDKKLDWAIDWAGVELVADSETLCLRSYLCPAQVWTNGWGETAGVMPGMRWTKEYADARLQDSIASFARAVLELCTRAPTAYQLAAMVSLAYNIGLSAFAKSSVLRLHNKGDFAGAARAFALWNKATINGKLTELRGLTIRRAKEAALYLREELDEVPAPIPQAVAAESPMRASPIIQSGAVAGTAGGLQLLASLSDGAKSAGDHVGVLGGVATQVQSVAGQVSGFVGITPQQLIGAAIVIAAGVAIYQRIKQRQGGWA